MVKNFGAPSQNIEDKRAKGHRLDRQNPNTGAKAPRRPTQRVNRYVKGDIRPKQSELEKLIKDIMSK